MKINKTIAIFALAAKKGHFVTFNYLKDNGEKTKRTIRIGVDVAKRMEKQGTPVNGKGNWHKGATHGLRGAFISKNGETYVRGCDMGDGGKFKIFKLSGISNPH